MTTVTNKPIDGQTTAAGEDSVEQVSTERVLAGLFDDATIAELAEQARSQGVDLLGDGGLLQQLTKRVLEVALDQEMDEHLGRERYVRTGSAGGNARNGRRSKTLITDVGPVPIQVPRDRDGTFTPSVVAKRQRRFGGIDNLVISLTAKGLTTGEVCAHLKEVYGTEVSKETISTITDRVLDSFSEWQSRPLDAVRLAQGWQWPNIQFALGETSVVVDDNVPIARTLLRLRPDGFRLQSDPAMFRLLASSIDVVVADLGEEREERTQWSADAALTFATRLRSDPDAAPDASWHVLSVSRDELAILRSALVELAYGTTRVLPDGVSDLEVEDLAKDFFRQLGR